MVLRKASFERRTSERNDCFNYILVQFWPLRLPRGSSSVRQSKKEKRAIKGKDVAGNARAGGGAEARKGDSVRLWQM